MASVQIDEHKILAPAGRLRSRIEAVDAGVRSGVRGRVRMARTGPCGRGAQLAPATGTRHDQLAACTTLDECRPRARQLAERHTRDPASASRSRATAPFRALSGAPPTSAYIAAHAAMRLDGPAGYAAERAWQSRWLVDRLDLHTDQ